MYLEAEGVGSGGGSGVMCSVLSLWLFDSQEILLDRPEAGALDDMLEVRVGGSRQR